MPSTAKQAETTAHKSVHAKPFTRVHRRPTRKDYEAIKEETSALASEVKDITYAWSRDATNEYGLLADIIRQSHQHRHIRRTTRAGYLLSGHHKHNTHTHAQAHGRGMGTCPIFVVHKKGFPPWCHRKFTRCPGRTILCPTQASPHGIPKYHPLPNSRTLNDRWCPIGIHAKKELRKEYYTKWDSDEHLTAFGKRLDYNQRALVQSDVTIADDDKHNSILKKSTIATNLTNKKC